MDDLIADILARIAEQCTPKMLEKLDLSAVESGIRRDWGGERHYVARKGEEVRARLTERDERIRMQHRRGERVPLLSRRWGLSERQIRRIVNA